MIIKCPKCENEVDNRNTTVVLNGCNNVEVASHCTICSSEFTILVTQEEANEIAKDYLYNYV